MHYGNPSPFSISMMISEDRRPTTSREPAPTNYTRVSIGDVGFIRRGQFHLLFSAGSPLGERQMGEDVPTTFEPLAVGKLAHCQPRIPGCLRTDTVKEVGAGLTTKLSTNSCVLSLRRLFTYIKIRRPGPWNVAPVSHLSSPGTVVQR